MKTNNTYMHIKKYYECNILQQNSDGVTANYASAQFKINCKENVNKNEKIQGDILRR